MKKFIFITLLVILASVGAHAQMNSFFPGPGMTSVAPTTCGSGVIDLSTGCTQPMFGGL